MHVLSEKPLAELPAEAHAMISQANESGVELAVNDTRRLFPAYARIREMIHNGEIGDLISLTYVDGREFSWQTESGFYFQGQSTRGVLLDKGVHGLDAICWWLGGKPTLISSQNDSFGGREALAAVEFTYDRSSVEVKFSWLSQLANAFSIVGERDRIEGGIEDWDTVKVVYNSGRTAITRLKVAERSYNDFAFRMLDNFIDVVQGPAQPLVSAGDVLPSIELIEECYNCAVRFKCPGSNP